MIRLIYFLLMFAACTAQAQVIEHAKRLFEEKKYEEAKKALAAVKDNNPEYAVAQYYLGRIAYDAENYEAAQDFLEEAVDANDKVADYHFWLGNAMGNVAKSANTFKQGILAPQIKSEYEKTIQLDPTNLGAHWGLVEFYTLAPGFMGGSWEKAEETAKRMLKLKKVEGHSALSTVYQRQEKWVEAEKHLVLACQEEWRYHYSLQDFYVKRKMHEKAFQFFEEAQRKNPDNMFFVFMVGRLCAISGEKLSIGEAQLLKYMTYQPKVNEPTHAGANMRLGQIKEKQGQKSEAKKYYEKALQLDANLQVAKEGLERVKGK